MAKIPCILHPRPNGLFYIYSSFNDIGRHLFLDMMYRWVDLLSWQTTEDTAHIVNRKPKWIHLKWYQTWDSYIIL